MSREGESENAFKGYWRTFGGIEYLLKSSYFWFSLVISCLSTNLWFPEMGKEPAWVETTLSVIPSLLGFSLGGMAIMLSFSSGRFLDAIRQDGRTDSYFMKMMASFFHFALVLTIALISAYLAKLTYPFQIMTKAIAFVGFFSSIYGTMLSMATVASVWHTARIFNKVVD